MRWLIRMRLRLRSLFRSKRIEHELEGEFRFLLNREVEENLAAGLSPEEARTAALRTMGGLDQMKEECRDARGMRWIENIFQDLRYGIRLMFKHRGFSAAAILTVAVGIAATTTIFSIVYGVVLQPLPYKEPGRLVSLWTKALKYNLPRAYVGAANYRDWREQSRTLEDIALVRHIANFNLTGAGDPERLMGARVTANLFTILGVQPAIGRLFGAENEQPGADHVVILSSGFWKRRFGSDPGIVGRTLLLNGEPYTVLGVMGPEFRYPAREFDLWAPLYVPPDEIQTRLSYSYLCVGRLKPGVTVAEAQSDLDMIAARLEREYPANEGIGVIVTRMLDDTVGPVRTALDVLLGAVGCLLLIGCVNVANLFLARGLARSRERAVRAALGASSWRLAAQAIVEVLPSIATGTVLGVAVAAWSLRAVLSILPASMPRVDEIGMSAPVLSFSVGLLVLTAILVAFWPAMQTAGVSTVETLKQEERSSSSGPALARVREILVISEIALSIMLVAGAGLLGRSFVELKKVKTGFETTHVLSMHMAIPRSKYPKDRDAAAFVERLLERIRAIPGVEAAGMVNRLPMGGGMQTGPIEFEGEDLPVSRVGNADWRTVTPDYFRAMGIPLIQGRLLSESDGEDSKMVALIDDHTARLIWQNQIPNGRRFRILLEGMPWVEIVGVVGTILHDSLDAEPRAQVYWNYRQRMQERMALVVRAGGDPAERVSEVVSQIRSVDPEQPVYDVATMDQVVGRTLSQRRLNMVLVGVFAAVSLLLAAIGSYGVAAYSVQQRVREFGIRMALGASPADLILTVVCRGALIAGIGSVLGLAAAGALGRLISTLLYNVSATDWISHSAAASILISVTLATSYLPVRRAVASDPMRSLRTE
jgi:putative ABC transport system permease protein